MKLFSIRNLHLWHRWLGIGLGFMVLLWFISGVVMMFVTYPRLTQEERIPHLQSVNPGLVKVNPAEALATFGGKPDKIRLNMLSARPVYHLMMPDGWHSIWADSGQVLSVNLELIRHSAHAFLPGQSISTIHLLDHDLWSISSSLNPHRPLYQVSFDNGDILYLSSHTSEVVLDTTRSERAWNWLGSVIHWVYITPLRFDHPEAWRQVIMWLSLPATVMGLIGIWLGIDRMRIRRRYKGGRITPYRGWAKWHHVSGLLAGALCLTWLFSGWLSVKPFDLFSGRKLSATESQAWAAQPDGATLPALPAHLANMNTLGEIEWQYFAGKPYLLGLAPQRSYLLDANTGALIPGFTTEALSAQAAQLLPDSKVKHATLLEHGDRYYYGKRLEALSPVVRLDLDDVADTSYYIDPATSRIVASHNNHSRTYRWLFAALHRLDFAPFDNAELPRWVIVILFSIGGTVLSAAGLVMGWRRLTRA
ncbi:PepSY domain-containing protein [Methylobacillus gramineus]|uniref:PepSY domain-containing protein n=1 Tax=Methylobacillus gramineus TaxID=755169 RepID=UPI001CFF65CA|nr:PepSY domain-containing protein [Methylobacillus gramineus]MCB5185481.1 PepSY domain-containing protein [Methylobacillus gramineus]